MSWRLATLAVVAAVTLLGLSPAFAEAPGGATIETAVELGTAKAGALPPGKESWYKLWDEGRNRALGVVLRFEPAPSRPNQLVTFNVWINEHTGLPDPRKVQIGQGTDSGLPAGMKYWRGGANGMRTYYFQVLNNTEGNVNYVLAFTGEAFPPPKPALAAATPSPPVPTVYEDSTYALGETRRIGVYTIHVWNGTSQWKWVANNIVTISALGQKTEQVEMVYKVDDLTGKDITGEGYPNIIVETYSGGAHCCSSTIVYALGPTLTKVFQSPPSNCGGRFQDLNGDGRYEFVTCDDSFAYKYCPYAYSPQVRVILKYEGGKGYGPASPLFPEQYASDIASDSQMAEEGAPAERAEWDNTTKCGVLPLVLDYLYLARPEQAWAVLEQWYRFPDRDDFWAEVQQIVGSSPLYSAP